MNKHHSVYFDRQKKPPFEEEMSTVSSETFGYRIWMAGDYDDAKRVLRKICSTMGTCYSIQHTDYIYSGGEETGFTVTVLNYPRFPKNHERLLEETEAVACDLMYELNQGSFTIEEFGVSATSDKLDHRTFFYSRRKGD